MSNKILHLYIDESQTKEGTYLCILGLCLNQTEIISLKEDIDSVLEEYGIKKQDRNLKRLRKNLLPFNKFSEQKKYELSEKIYDKLKKRGAVLIASIVDKTERGFSSSLEAGIYFIVERFYYLLKPLAEGFLFCDTPPENTKKYRNKIIEIVEEGKEYRGEYFRNHIYPTVYFSDDESDTMIQLADLIAYNLSSYITKCIKDIPLAELSEIFDFDSPSLEGVYFKFIRGLFRTRSGKINGNGIKCIY